MKRITLLALASFTMVAENRAQLLAGEVPAGGSALDQNINLILSAPFSADSSGLEIDCDDFPDLMAILVRGEPAIDAPNVAMLRLIDTDLEILANGTTSASRPLYLDAGEPIVPAGAFDWYAAGTFTLGDFGTFTATGPVQINGLYIGVRRGGQAAWIQLSFLLNNALSVSLQVQNALSFCGLTTGIEEHGELRLRLSPTVTHGEAIAVGANERWQAIDVFDATGQHVARHIGGGSSIPAPEIPGTYLVRAWPSSGPPVAARITRL